MSLEWRIHRYENVDSTMRIAATLPLGSVVVSDGQSAGIGRHGHVWDSRAGEGLYMSVVLQPHPVLTLALGLAAHAAMARVTSIQCDIRWPNDLMIGDKKIGGILVQVSDGHPVAGLGVNIGQRRFPPELERTATSLALETDLQFRRDDLLFAVLDEIPKYATQTSEEVIANWERVSTWGRGKLVQVDRGGQRLTGVTAGLDRNGFLQVQKSNGDIELVVAGGVRAL